MFTLGKVRRISPKLYWLQVGTWTFSLHCNLLMLLVGPGYLARAKEASEGQLSDDKSNMKQALLKTEVSDRLRDILFCKECNILREPGVEHCRICERCVMDFDHHCTVLNCCIGRRNYYLFHSFLVSLTCTALSSVFCVVVNLVDDIRFGTLGVNAKTSNPIANVLNVIGVGLVFLGSYWSFRDRSHVCVYSLCSANGWLEVFYVLASANVKGPASCCLGVVCILPVDLSVLICVPSCFGLIGYRFVKFNCQNCREGISTKLRFKLARSRTQENEKESS